MHVKVLLTAQHVLCAILAIILSHLFEKHHVEHVFVHSSSENVVNEKQVSLSATQLVPS